MTLDKEEIKKEFDKLLYTIYEDGAEPNDVLEALRETLDNEVLLLYGKFTLTKEGRGLSK